MKPLPDDSFRRTNPTLNPGNDPDDIPDLDPAPPLSAEEVTIFGEDPDDISDPAVPLTLQEALKEGTHKGRTDTQAANVTPDTPQHAQVSTASDTRFNEHEALLQGFLHHFTKRFDEGVKDSVREITKTVDGIYEFVHHQMQIQREKAQQAETLLDTLTTKAVTQGIQLRHDPYTVTVQTLSPQGFPVTLTLAKQDKGELVEELGNLVQWLAQEGYKPISE
jgi:hypothetical protein